MKKAYAASQNEKQVFQYIPKLAHCLKHECLNTIRNLSDITVFFWLTSGNGYWYHIIRVQGNMVYGYVLKHGWWYYNPIDKRKVVSYY